MKSRDDKKKYILKMIAKRPDAVLEALKKAVPEGQSDGGDNEEGKFIGSEHSRPGAVNYLDTGMLGSDRWENSVYDGSVGAARNELSQNGSNQASSLRKRKKKKTKKNYLRNIEY
jgi:hypothetical protein